MSILIPRRILVPTDFGEPASHALRYASALAQQFGARLLVMYADAFIPPVDFAAIPAGEFEFTQAELIERANERLQAYAKSNINPLVPYETEVVVNDPVNAIVTACEWDTDLVVMGTHGRTGVRRMLFGSITAAVMRLAPLPVIAVNRATPEIATVTRVLCPVTFTSVCRDALRFAANLTDARFFLFRGVGNQVLQDSIDDLIQFLDWVPADLAHRCELTMVPTDASAEQIVASAKITEADLIVLEVPADRRIVDAVRGTIAERVVQQSECPVLTINARATQANIIKDVAAEMLHQA